MIETDLIQDPIFTETSAICRLNHRYSSAFPVSVCVHSDLFRWGQVRQLDTVVPVVRVALNASIWENLMFPGCLSSWLMFHAEPLFYSVEPFGGILVSHLAGRTHNGWFFALRECGLMRSTTYDSIACVGLWIPEMGFLSGRSRFVDCVPVLVPRRAEYVRRVACLSASPHLCAGRRPSRSAPSEWGC